MKKLLLLLMTVVLAAACTSRGANHGAQTADSTATPPGWHFRAVAAPAQGSAEQQRLYMVEHYWDKFDFQDTVFITKVDTLEMVQAFSAYVSRYVGPMNGQPIGTLMQRAATSRKMFDYFSFLGETVLHDPNSPLRSDELYIPVLQAQVAAPFYDKYEKIAPAYDLKIALQNRIGHKANDFKYRTFDGRSSHLYALQADYVLIFINNPDCTMCKTIHDAICASPVVTQMLAAGQLKLLAIYPDKDLAAWRKYAAQIPTTWINAYDPGCQIDKQQLYDLKAIPSMYLLDAQKRVLVKDSTEVGEVEYILNQK